jgi:hypothetical protein
MNLGANRWKLRMAVVLVAGGAMLLWALNQQRQPAEMLTIVNQSGQTITELKITVAGHTSTIKNIPAGREVVPPGVVQSDEPFTLEGTFAGGDIIRVPSGKTKAGLKVIVLPGGGISIRFGDKS